MNALVPLRIGAGLPGPGRLPADDFDPAIAELILDRLSNGEFMIQICAEEGMPSVTKLARWERQNPAFSKDVARARTLGARCLMEMGILVAITPGEGRTMTYRSDGSIEMRKEDPVAARKLAAWGYLEAAKKIAPAEFGDKVALTGGSETDAPIKGTVRVIEEVFVRHERLTE